MTEYLREIDFRENTICEIKDALNKTSTLLSDELSDSKRKSLYNDNTKFQIQRIINLISIKNILDMPLYEVEKYIKDLIAIIEFIIGEY